jgi:hypothetical protein
MSLSLKFMPAWRKEVIGARLELSREIAERLFDCFHALFCAAEIRGVPNIEVRRDALRTEGTLLREDETGPEHFAAYVTKQKNVFSVSFDVHLDLNVDTRDFPALRGCVYLRVTPFTPTHGKVFVYSRGKRTPTEQIYTEGAMPCILGLFGLGSV